MTGPSRDVPSGLTADRWCADLLVALRLREVPGDRSGAVLAEVRDHLASSAQDPETAFGTPGEFADALVRGRPAPRRGARPLQTARDGAGVAGLLSGRPAVLTELQVALPVLLALAAPPLLDAVARARRRALVGRGALVTAAVTAVALLHAGTGPFLSLVLPAPALLVPGLVVTAAWIATTARAVDPVVDPWRDATGVTRQRRRDGAAFAALMLLLLLVPVAFLTVLRHLT
ncbi:hypothetical protein AB2L27_19585 [Kineococcus sp. LSe6-4]|uniref:Integral membrane protein n=1 Tax=Kineococcus halophytocola TaxID=3234027 RepID=A0ABV4H5V6_9ACTN